jgi:hypothetical protein
MTTYRITGQLCFPVGMDPVSYDAGVSFHDWYEDGDDLFDATYSNGRDAMRAIHELRRRYKGNDVYGVSCVLELEEVD